MTQHYLGEQKAWFGAAADAKEGRHKYVTMTSSGVKEEGAPMRKLFDDPVDAIRAYADELEKYTKAHDIVVWRCLPQLDGSELGFSIFSRLYRTNINHPDFPDERVHG